MTCLCPMCNTIVQKIQPVVVNIKHLRMGGTEREIMSVCPECAPKVEPYDYNEVND